MQADMSLAQGAPHAHAHMDSVVKLKSLPFDATQLDIIQFFQQFKLKPNGVQLVVRSDNKPTGEVRSPPHGSSPPTLPELARYLSLNTGAGFRGLRNTRGGG
jgi:hypothetical protein